mmetsp:Transcript_26855/g.65265  ORF Transcript_26855/g.65265 Transcript_26855/m.65265 type:complete len:310 (-) Transcript_26855:390-1319(-)
MPAVQKKGVRARMKIRVVRCPPCFRCSQFLGILALRPKLVALQYDAAKPGEKVADPGVDHVSKAMKFSSTLPIRYSAVHICRKEGSGIPQLKDFLLRAILKFSSQYRNVSTTVHSGSDESIQHELRTRHGFPDTFPIDANGNMRRDILNVWFHLHMSNDPCCIATFNRIMVQEEDDTNIDVIASDDEDMEDGDAETPSYAGSNRHVAGSGDVVARNAGDGEPTTNDVFLGRGRDIQNNRGNVHFREFLARYQDDYNQLPRNQRGKLATQLTRILRDRGVRFFQWSGAGEWEEVESVTIEQKVSQLLREL